jgi:hypothetical protein
MRMKNRTFVLPFSDILANRNGLDPAGTPNLTRFSDSIEAIETLQTFR